LLKKKHLLLEICQTLCNIFFFQQPFDHVDNLDIEICTSHMIMLAF